MRKKVKLTIKMATTSEKQQSKGATATRKPKLAEIKRSDMRFYWLRVPGHRHLKSLRGVAPMTGDGDGDADESEDPKKTVATPATQQRTTHVFKHLGFNRFADELTEVPVEAELTDTPTDSWIKEYFMDVEKTRIIPSLDEFPSTGGLLRDYR